MVWKIAIYKVVDEIHIGNVELTYLDPYGDDPNIYIFLLRNDTCEHPICMMCFLCAWFYL